MNNFGNNDYYTKEKEFREIDHNVNILTDCGFEVNIFFL